MPCPSPPRPDVCRTLLVLLIVAASLSSLAIGDATAAELPAVAPAGLIQWG